MNTINLDILPTEKMTHELYCYLMELDCRGISKELPLGDTGFDAIWKGTPIKKTTLVRIIDNEMFFLAGTVLSGYWVKRYKLKENEK